MSCVHRARPQLLERLNDAKNLRCACRQVRRAALLDGDQTQRLGLKRLLVGSTSEHVVHCLHRPVMIVRGGEGSWPPAQVLVGLDNTTGAKCAARLAATITHLYKDAAIELVEAYPELSVAADRFLDPDR